MVTIPLHLGTDPTELRRSLGNHNLQLVVSPLACCLVLGTELGSQLRTTCSSKCPGIGSFLVVLVNSLLEGLLGSDGVALDLSGIDSHRLVGLLMRAFTADAREAIARCWAST